MKFIGVKANYRVRMIKYVVLIQEEYKNKFSTINSKNNNAINLVNFGRRIFL